MLSLTPKAASKVLEILEKDGPSLESAFKKLRVGIQGGGCSGFQYSLSFDEKVNPADKVFEFTGTAPNGDMRKLQVVVDQASMLYLDGTEIDYLETLEGAGFKFNNPNVKSTCGCGSSFQT